MGLTPTFSTPAIMPVPHFPFPHFQSPPFGRHHCTRVVTDALTEDNQLLSQNVRLTPITARIGSVPLISEKKLPTGTLDFSLLC